MRYEVKKEEKEKEKKKKEQENGFGDPPNAINSGE